MLLESQFLEVKIFVGRKGLHLRLSVTIFELQN